MRAIVPVLAAAALGCGGSTVQPARTSPPVDSKKQVEFGLKALGSPDPVQRAIAAATLATQGAKEALPELKKLADDPDPTVRQAVRDAVKKLEAAP